MEKNTGLVLCVGYMWLGGIFPVTIAYMTSKGIAF